MNMVNVVNMMNVKMVKIRINRDSLSNKRRGVFRAANKIESKSPSLYWLTSGRETFGRF